jgi:hypothetical protein
LGLSLLAACAAGDKNAEAPGIPDPVAINNPMGNPPARGADYDKAKTGEEGLKESTDATNGIPQYTEKKLIKNGEIGFQVNSLGETKRRIETTLKAKGGYISKENSYDYSSNPTDELIVRVPSKEFDAFLSEVLNGVDKIDYKRIDIEDVTEQFVDIEARLRSKKALEAKYSELLIKAANMDDILKIRKEMEIIREDIEAAEGRLKYLSNQVGYSTLRITYYEHKAAAGFNFSGKLGNALKDGSTGFLYFLIAMVQLWPLWLMGGLLWWMIVKLIRRNRRKKQQA